MKTSEIAKISTNSVVKVKAGVVVKDEEDNWGIIYDPATDISFTINPVSVFICKQLKTKHMVKNLISKVKEKFSNVPNDVEADVIELLKNLLKKELISLVKESKKKEP